MTLHVNEIPDEFIWQVYALVESDREPTDEDSQCILKGYNDGLLPEEIASMLDHASMIKENEGR